jgi:hypothetical protein
MGNITPMAAQHNIKKDAEAQKLAATEALLKVALGGYSPRSWFLHTHEARRLEATPNQWVLLHKSHP